jgi:hypothetical protein
MIKRRRVYEPRVFDGRVITSDEIERIYKEVLKFERIEAISDPMRELIEEPLARASAQAAAKESAGLMMDSFSNAPQQAARPASGTTTISTCSSTASLSAAS